MGRASRGKLHAILQMPVIASAQDFPKRGCHKSVHPLAFMFYLVGTVLEQ